MITDDMIGETLTVYLKNDRLIEATGVLTEVNHLERTFRLKSTIVSGTYKIKKDDVCMVLIWGMGESVEPDSAPGYDKIEAPPPAGRDILITPNSMNEPDVNQQGSFLPSDMLISSESSDSDDDFGICFSNTPPAPVEHKIDAWAWLNKGNQETSASKDKKDDDTKE